MTLNIKHESVKTAKPCLASYKHLKRAAVRAVIDNQAAVQHMEINEHVDHFSALTESFLVN